jgi:hypothetical protein
MEQENEGRAYWIAIFLELDGLHVVQTCCRVKDAAIPNHEIEFGLQRECTTRAGIEIRSSAPCGRESISIQSHNANLEIVKIAKDALLILLAHD